MLIGVKQARIREEKQKSFKCARDTNYHENNKITIRTLLTTVS